MDRFQSFQLPDSEGVFGSWSVRHGDSVTVSPHIDNTALTTTPSFTSLATVNETFEPLAAGPNCLASDAQFSKDLGFCNQDTIINPPRIWGNTSTSLESQTSPAAVFMEAAYPKAIDSTFNHHLDFSPDLLSPGIMRKPVSPRQSKVASNIATRPRCAKISNEATPLGRSSLEVENTTRDLYLYQNVTPKADGLYHCPWEGQEVCQHKPGKLKCNYNNFVDSHLKPYKCKVPDCEGLPFSSLPNLFRHERETHAMYGHGDKPYLCTDKECERSIPGNGFPRYWNFKDHMKRVHNELAPTEKKAVKYTSLADEPTKGKKRKVDSVDLDEAPKRSATLPVATGQFCESRLLEHYHQHEQRLLEIVKHLHDPRNANNMHLLWSATNCITVMAQTIERIKGSSTSGKFKQTNQTK